MPRLVRIRARNTRAREDDDGAPPPSPPPPPRTRALVVDTRNRARATQRRHARSTPRGSLEVRARIRRARMRVAMTGSTPRLEDAATPPHASKEPVATDADASSQSTT
jgi:hypothetical protein